MYHIAQVNIARLKAPAGDSQVAGFFDNVSRINELAETSKGFVWRYVDDYGSDPLLAFNLSVWESIEDLGAFVYRSGHVEIMRRKQEWMQPMVSAHAALWWIKSGQLPTPATAMEKLELISNLGPTPQAFTFSKRFDSPDTL